MDKNKNFDSRINTIELIAIMILNLFINSNTCEIKNSINEFFTTTNNQQL